MWSEWPDYEYIYVQVYIQVCIDIITYICKWYCRWKKQVIQLSPNVSHMQSGEVQFVIIKLSLQLQKWELYFHIFQKTITEINGPWRGKK